MVGHTGNIPVLSRNGRNRGGVGWGGAQAWGWGVRWRTARSWWGLLMRLGEEMILEESSTTLGTSAWSRSPDSETRFV